MRVDGGVVEEQDGRFPDGVFGCEGGFCVAGWEVLDVGEVGGFGGGCAGG